MDINRRPRMRRLAIAIAGIVVLGAGCSGGADTGASSTTGAESSAEAPESQGPIDRYADVVPKLYAGTKHWLCHPETDDICDSDQDSTPVEPNGVGDVERWTEATDAPVDCFYVYPTISRDSGGNSDLRASDDEEGLAALDQVARLGQECRVFAPVYRQATLAALAGQVPDVDRELSYRDVRQAWRAYMNQWNEGRGVVLVGHSQGSFMLRQLIIDEIDPHADVRDHLIAAYLAGGSVAVPDGADVGGDFAHVPVCREEDQTGCVLSWASFRSTQPPTGSSFFGRVNADGQQAVCVTPADLSGDDAELHPYFPAARSATILAAAGAEPTGDDRWIDPDAGTVTTPFVSTPGLLTGECTRSDGVAWFSVTVDGDPSDARADDIGGDLTPEWGLHLVDVNLVMGDMVRLVKAQSAAYLAG